MKGHCVKVLVATGLAHVRELIAAAGCGDDGGFTIVGAGDLTRVEQWLLDDSREVDTVLVHLADIEEDTLGAVIGFLRRVPRLPVAIILPEGAPAGLTQRLLIHGAAAAMPETLSPAALRHVLSLMSMEVPIAALERDAFDRGDLTVTQRLSDRELQVLSGICDGLQNKEIAHGFNIKEVTVKMHVRAIIRKLDAKNRTHAAMIARDMGLVH